MNGPLFIATCVSCDNYTEDDKFCMYYGVKINRYAPKDCRFIQAAIDCSQLRILADDSVILPEPAEDQGI